MKRFDTVIFDLDGTLMNTLDDLCTAVDYALDAKGTVTTEHILKGVNNGVRELISRVSSYTGISCDLDLAISRFVEKYNECYADKTYPYEGICELLSKLRSEGYKIAVVSNKVDEFVKHLCKVKLPEGTVDFALGNCDSFPPKPAPDGVFAAMEAVGCNDASRVCYVGDSDVDMETAKNAGFFKVGVSWGFRPPELLSEKGADVICKTANELYKVISET